MALSVSALTVTAFVSGSTTSAAAKSKSAKVLKTTNYKSKHKVHVRGGWMYSNTKLTHKNHHMTKYLYTKFYATKKVTVRQANGKKATLNYLRSKNGKVKGYVHSTYVWNRWGYGKYSVAAYRKSAVASINQDRADQGLPALKETAKLDKIAQRNSDRMLKDGKKFKVNVEGTPHAGWIIDDYIAPKSNPIVHYKNGSQWGEGSDNSWMRRSDINRDIGAIPYLMSKKHTRIGLGGTQHGEAIYMFVLLSND
ncbi:hypothetical protein FD13_GL000862 [Levilactobacillus senmaizukei DSM 21775 = NBRC 103853]|uniref:SCP domain-containing protein n=2 Tax=Levilactobacillus senmaizukei TaxID=431273 RepID=A0A0R2DI79_9LACO|nr:hypothetical protein FD13_GL000862 [Levilactobacillus senmaizukei DSM 21775 = NBRC 103853]